MRQSNINRNTISYFKRWTRNKAGVKLSLNRIIKICVLTFTLLIIDKPSKVLGQAVDSFGIAKEIDLEEVEVVGQASPDVFSQLARTISVISTKEISSSPASSIQDLLEYVAGVDIRQRNINGVQADIQMRGGSFDQVLVLLNGINITDPQTGHFNLNIPLNLAAVERVEILHGSGARLYGANAYKGVINIISKQKWEGVSAGAEVGEFGLLQTNADIGFAFKKHYHSISLSQKSSDGYVENTDYKLRNVYYNGGLETKYVDLYWQSGIGSKAYGANDFYSPYFPEQYEETSTGFGSLGFKTSTAVKLNGYVYFRRHEDYFLLKRNDPDFYENQHKTDTYGLKLFTGFESIFGKTYLGTEYRSEDILSTVLGNEMKTPLKVKGSPGNFYTHQYKRNYTSFILEQKYHSNNFYISTGILLNYNKEYKQNLGFFPGIDLSYRLADQRLKVFMSFSRSLRLPTFTDMFYKDPANKGNPFLEPEELSSLEMGLEFKTGNLTTRLSAFNDRGNNVIDWVMFEGSSVYEAQNISKIESRGIEGIANYINRFGSSDIRIENAYLSYAYIYQDLITGNYESKYADDYLKHKMVAKLKMRIFDKIILDYSFRYQSRNGSFSDYKEEADERLIRSFEPYALSDFCVIYTMNRIRFNFKINNLFNTDYTDVGNLFQPGRIISAGMQLNFPGFEKNDK